MKHKFLLLALIAMLTGMFTSCNKDGVLGNYPILYVVNGTDYSVNVFCDNLLVASAGAHNNSGKVELANTSVNLPVYVACTGSVQRHQVPRSHQGGEAVGQI